MHCNVKDREVNAMNRPVKHIPSINMSLRQIDGNLKLNLGERFGRFSLLSIHLSVNLEFDQGSGENDLDL